MAKTDRSSAVFGLLSYNRGVARALDGDRPGALEDFEAAAKWAEGRTRGDTVASCLFVLREEAGELTVEEVTEKPEIRELALEGIRLLRLAESNYAGEEPTVISHPPDGDPTSIAG
jgi:hypothetical protein